jgi:hypothetical protein
MKKRLETNKTMNSFMHKFLNQLTLMMHPLPPSGSFPDQPLIPLSFLGKIQEWKRMYIQRINK